MAQDNNKRSRSPTREDRGRLPSPILAMSGYDEINTFLCSKIKEQSAAMVTVTEKLQQLCKCKASHDGPPNLYKLLLAGPSGCGKTETVRWVKYLLGMDTGYEHEGQFIEIERECTDSLDTLVRTLNDALVPIEDDEQQTKKASVSAPQQQKRKYPRFILMGVDDVSPRFLASINTLLSNGRQVTENNRSFRIPQETMLFIIFTCNYGEAQIREMKYRVEHEASYFVKADMSQHELSEHQMSLMGKIVPFYPLKTEALRSILMDRLEQFIHESEICRQFGEIKYDGDVKNMLIDKVIDLTGPGSGIRSGLGELFDKIDGFFEKALRELTRKEQELQLRNKDENNSLIISLREIDAKEMEAKLEKECDQFIREIIQSLLKDPQSLEMIQYHSEKHEHINALSMHFDMHHLATSDLCGSVIYAHQQTNLFNHCQFGVSPVKYARLKEENRGLRQAIGRVETLVTQSIGKGSKNPPLISEIRDIITRSAKEIALHNNTTDDEDEDNDAAYMRGRVEEVIGNESGEIQQLVCQTTSPTTSSSEEEEEEEEEIELLGDKICRLYGDLDPQQLGELSLSSDLDESSGEERKRVKEREVRKNNVIKKKLLRESRHRLLKCEGVCKGTLSCKKFNPQLRKYRGGHKLTFRKKCNACRNDLKKANKK